MKIVINKCFGGFSISNKALDMMISLGHEESKRYAKEILPERSSIFINDSHGIYNLKRNDPILIKTIETLGLEEASGRLAKLAIVEIPDDVNWEIDEYDGWEKVKEKSREWE